MMNIKIFLKRWPKFYHLIQRSYYAFRCVMEVYIVGTKLQEWIWKTRHIFRSNKWTQECIETRNHPRRHILIEKISSFAPITSIMEIGCSSGANLYLLAKKYSDANLYGVDINTKAVKEGNTYFKQQGIPNVNLFVHRADRLTQFANKSVDVIFTDATLMYIGLDKIKRVINEMKRISCKGLIFSEWHCEDNSRGYLWYDGHWIYNFKTLLAEYFPTDDVKISKHPEGIWNDEGWRKFGSIVEVRV